LLGFDLPIDLSPSKIADEALGLIGKLFRLPLERSNPIGDALTLSGLLRGPGD
jgi:hypothetical protein